MSGQSGRDNSRTILGIVLIIAGVLSFLGVYTGASVGVWLWIIALAAAAVLFIFIYSQNRELWALILAYIFGANCILLLLITQLNVSGVIVPVFVLAGVSVPFIIAWLQHRSQWGLLIPPYILLAIIPILWFEDTGDLIPAYVLGVIGAPFVVSAVLARKWPLLIPGGILWLIAAIFLFSGWDIFATVMSIIGRFALPLLLLLIGGGMLLTSFRDRDKAGHDEEDKPKRQDGLSF